ncbi:MAG: alpha-glucan family phosphorylase, partial [Candidatus Binatia bacterium]
MTGTAFTLEVQPRIPARLARLPELANDLLYSWDRHMRGLFIRLDRELWTACGHNPKLFLRRVSQRVLDEAEQDRGFLGDYNRVVSSYETYLQDKSQPGIERFLDPESDLVAYFCAEFGFHESFSIYSGGLGILAGDHCKAASDLGVPFVAMGLLYRQGYFSQTIDAHGKQISHPAPIDFGDLPITPAQSAEGEELRVSVELPGREVQLRVWQVKAGHITLYLLDSDLTENREADRSITFQLYGGDIRNRIQQEMVLGIGGVRALHALGLKPTVWHINEGHAALMILERCCEYVEAGMDFPAALELTAAGTVFTTHTPVQAGHDVFERELAAKYLASMAKRLSVEIDVLLELGVSPINHDALNMTALALRGSR